MTHRNEAYMSTLLDGQWRGENSIRRIVRAASKLVVHPFSSRALQASSSSRQQESERGTKHQRLQHWAILYALHSTMHASQLSDISGQ